MTVLDVTHAYRRYQFLGDEFLTWLWYVIDSRFEVLREVDPEIVGLEIGNRMVLQNRRAEGGLETVTIRGDNPDLEEAMLAVRKGAMVSEVHLIYRRGDLTWQFALKGESLNISSLKPPETGPTDTSADIEGAVIEKISLYESVTRLVQNLFCRFVRMRIHADWERSELPEMRRWLKTA